MDPPEQPQKERNEEPIKDLVAARTGKLQGILKTSQSSTINPQLTSKERKLEIDEGRKSKEKAESGHLKISDSEEKSESIKSTNRVLQESDGNVSMTLLRQRRRTFKDHSNVFDIMFEKINGLKESQDAAYMKLNRRIEHVELANRNLNDGHDTIRQELKGFENYQKKLLREIKDIDAQSQQHQQKAKEQIDEFSAQILKEMYQTRKEASESLLKQT